jgi:hypothetical protein
MYYAIPVGWRWAWIMSGDSWEDNGYDMLPRNAVSQDINDWLM